MARTIEKEIERAESAGIATKSSFSVQIRDVELNSIHDGDILIFTEKYTVIPQKIRGSEEPVEMMYVTAKRNGKNVTVPFYPSMFWKRREVADANNKPTGEYKHSTGEVVDFVQDQGDLNKAIKEIAKNHPNGVLVKFDNFKTLRYGEPTDGTGRVQNANIPILTWA